MHRRVNSNIVESKPRDLHRRTLSSNELKFSQFSSNGASSVFCQKASLILPDSLNSSLIQPHMQTEEEKFIDILDSSIKYFTTAAPPSSSLKQISDLKSQISVTLSQIEVLKTSKSRLTAKLSSLALKNKDSEQENEELEEYVAGLKIHVDKLKNSIREAESELRSIKKRNLAIEGSNGTAKRTKSNLFDVKEGLGHFSNDEFDVFNPEESNNFGEMFQFANPSPRAQGKNLYSRSKK